MNSLIGYLISLLGEKSCPVDGVNHATDLNGPWHECLTIRFKDGTVLELVEKPSIKTHGKEILEQIMLTKEEREAKITGVVNMRI